MHPMYVNTCRDQYEMPESDQGKTVPLPKKE